MENLLDKAVKTILQKLDKHNQYTELEHLQMYFGLQILIYNLITTFVILLLAYALDCLFGTLFIFSCFGTLRIIAGGYHFDSIAKCITVTTLFMVGGGKCVQLISVGLPACILICLSVNILFFSYLPQGTNKNSYAPKYSLKQQRRLRILSIIFTIAALLFESPLRTAILFSMAIVALLLCPLLFRKSQVAE